MGEAWGEGSSDFPFGSPVARVFVVAGEAIVREGVVHILESTPDFVVVGQAATARVAISAMRGLHPDLVVTDGRLPASDGVSLVRTAQEQVDGVACVVLTAPDDPTIRRRCWLAGAAACVSRDAPATELLRVCRDVAAGGRPLTCDAASARPASVAPADDADLAVVLAGLTAQERRIAQLLSQGMTNRQIALTLYLSERTVRNYVSNVLVKLNVANRTQAATYVTRLLADLRGHPGATEPG